MYRNERRIVNVKSLSEADFAFRLGQRLLAANNKPDINILYSPISIWLPLAALTNAVDDRDKPMLLEVLGAKNASQIELNDYAKKMLSDLKIPARSDSPMKIANTLLVASGDTVKKEFNSIFEYAYLGRTFNVDFASPKAINAVNDWISRNTGGLINNVADSRTFNINTSSVILNVIYFSDKWSLKFDTGNTKPGPFHAPFGDVTAKFMLRECNSQQYFEDEHIQAIALDCRNGAKYQIANDFLESLTALHFNNIKGKCRRRKGKLLLPRFEVNIDIDLGGALKEIGVSIFGTPLSGLIENGSVIITSVKQRAVIKVDEKGTTAATVTSYVGGYAAAFSQLTDPFVMVCDKPFAFVLQKEGQILFMGVVNNPKA
jgi:serpin B